uniref:hypothetical protein n=1 Tax=Enterocloster clostridioformis TaxID=1531 RepID=UPI0033318580
FPSVMTTLCTGCFSLLAIIIGLLMIIDFIIEDLMLNSYLQKNFHTLTNPAPNSAKRLKVLFLKPAFLLILSSDFPYLFCMNP